MSTHSNVAVGRIPGLPAGGRQRDAEPARWQRRLCRRVVRTAGEPHFLRGDYVATTAPYAGIAVLYLKRT